MPEQGDAADSLQSRLISALGGIDGDKLMLINVSPRFVLDTDKLKVMEYTSGSTVTHAFDDNDLPLRIFRDRMNGWFFEPATKLLQKGDSVAAIHIVTPLIEALQERYEGKPSKGKSADFFKRRAKEIFGIRDDDALALLYAGLRSGFAHHGFLKDDEKKYNILLTDGLGEPIKYVDSVLWIDSKQYIDKIRNAYEKYYTQVELESELRKKFMAVWSDDWQMSLRVPGGAGTTTSGPA